MSEEVIAGIVTVVVAVGVNLYRQFAKDKAEAHLRTLAWATQLAYHVTNEVAKFTSTTVDDKAAYAMAVFKDALAKQGITPTAAELETAQLSWKGMHGQEKMAAALVTMSPQMPPA